MQVVCTDTAPHRYVKAFACWTRILLQVRGPGTMFFSHEQGESQNPNDGVQLTQAGTATPVGYKWKGELWYRSDTINQSFVIIILGEDDSWN